MYSANDEQNHFTEYIKELKGKKKAPYNFNLRKVKEGVLDIVAALLKRREMVFTAFKGGAFLSLNNQNNHKNQIIQKNWKNQSEQSSNDDKYTSLKLGNDLRTSSNTSHISFSSNWYIPLSTPPKKEPGLKI